MNEGYIIYVADLDQDIDDYIAACYLHQKQVLTGIVCDPEPTSKEGIFRQKSLQKKGITFFPAIPHNTEIVIVGGALQKTEQFLQKNTLKYLFIQGGYVGCNIIPQEKILPKFCNKQFVRTYNFNLNVKATHNVLQNPNAKHIVLIGKHICHNIQNTSENIWSTDDTAAEILKEHKIEPRKRLHDLLVCHEALAFLKVDMHPFLKYQTLYPETENGLQGSYTKWGSSKQKNIYQPCLTAVEWLN